MRERKTRTATVTALMADGAWYRVPALAGTELANPVGIALRGVVGLETVSLPALQLIDRVHQSLVVTPARDATGADPRSRLRWKPAGPVVAGPRGEPIARAEQELILTAASDSVLLGDWSDADLAAAAAWKTDLRRICIDLHHRVMSMVASGPAKAPWEELRERTADCMASAGITLVREHEHQVAAVVPFHDACPRGSGEPQRTCWPAISLGRSRFPMETPPQSAKTHKDEPPEGRQCPTPADVKTSTRQPVPASLMRLYASGAWNCAAWATCNFAADSVLLGDQLTAGETPPDGHIDQHRRAFGYIRRAWSIPRGTGADIRWSPISDMTHRVLTSAEIAQGVLG